MSVKADMMCTQNRRSCLRIWFLAWPQVFDTGTCAFRGITRVKTVHSRVPFTVDHNNPKQIICLDENPSHLISYLNENVRICRICKRKLKIACAHLFSAQKKFKIAHTQKKKLDWTLNVAVARTKALIKEKKQYRLSIFVEKQFECSAFAPYWNGAITLSTREAPLNKVPSHAWPKLGVVASWSIIGGLGLGALTIWAGFAQSMCNVVQCSTRSYDGCRAIRLGLELGLETRKAPLPDPKCPLHGVSRPNLAFVVPACSSE